MTPKQKRRMEQIEKRRERRYRSDVPVLVMDRQDMEDIDFLLSLVKEQEAVTGIADDLPYRIVEEMGLGLTFRSCTCGQLPCARLRPLRDALETVATSMRSACVEKVLAKADALREQIKDAPAAFISAVSMAQDVVRDLAKELETLSIEQPKEK